MKLPVSWLGGRLPNLGTGRKIRGMRVRVDIKYHETL